MTQIWEKHPGRAQLAELADNIKRRELPDKIIIELDPRQLSLVLSCMRTQSYKLHKEDKPWIPEPGKSNANHTRQTGLVKIAQQIEKSIKTHSDRNKQQSTNDNNASQRGTPEAIQLPGDGLSAAFSSGSQRSGNNPSGGSEPERSVTQPLEQTQPDIGSPRQVS
jgi:hypothetical protein